MIDELLKCDALEIGSLVRKGEVSPLEVVDTFIRRIEAMNPALNAVVTQLFGEARDAARRPFPDSPFAGVPILLKDLGMRLKGAPMMAGTRAFQQNYPVEDSSYVLKLKRAGTAILGKSNTPEFGLYPVTESILHGPCRNPWDKSRTPGGSSGGSAAAVAARMVPCAHGNDGGGSLRVPAACCGVFALKPSRGRNSIAPYHSHDLEWLIQDHFLTRSVRDSAALLDLTCGALPSDHFAAPTPERPFLEEVDRSPGTLRIAATTGGDDSLRIHPECRRAVEETAGILEDLGHRVEFSAPPVQTAALHHDFLIEWAVGVVRTLDDVKVAGVELNQQNFEPVTLALYELGQSYSSDATRGARARQEEQARRLLEWFREIDVWVTPVTGYPAPPIGHFEPSDEDPLSGVVEAFNFVPYCSWANISGSPAMSVPLHWTDDGLPVGVQFMADYGREDLLFCLAAQLEEARPWKDRSPEEAE